MKGTGGEGPSSSQSCSPSQVALAVPVGDDGIWKDIFLAQYCACHPSHHLGGRPSDLRQVSAWWSSICLLVGGMEATEDRFSLGWLRFSIIGSRPGFGMNSGVAQLFLGLGSVGLSSYLSSLMG